MEDWEDWVDFPDSEINRMMVEAAFKGLRVKAVSTEGNVYEGVANTYIQGGDEESGFPCFCITTDDKGRWGINLNEIKSIEILS
ncbi:MAG: hypothetical protein LUG15_08025 [Oscillospiraceae bacterium]|nr:hypothetical protein [Oscillospiraceae bacterium]MCD8365544.1 hypothetical protein [Clostridiales bacterium]